MSRVLVAGSYPPVPRPASAVTVEVVRRLRGDGHQVEVVSPRPSAADHSARIEGIRAWWWLTRLRRQTGSNTLVVCMEIGMPLDPSAGRGRRRYQIALLGRAFDGFDRVSLLVADDISGDMGALAGLWPHADEVVVATEGQRDVAIGRAGVPPAMVRIEASGSEGLRPEQVSYGALPDELPPQVAIRDRAEVLRRDFEPMASVTLFGPSDWAWYEQPRRIVSLGARRLLGRHADPIRAIVAHMYRRVRPAG